MKKQFGIIAALGMTAALALTGCSSTTSDGAADKTVTVLTHDDFTLPDELIQQFESETGYTLETVTPGDGGTVVGQLVLTKDNPNVDAVFGLNSFNAMEAVKQDVLETYTSSALPESAAAYDLDNHMTPIDIGSVCVNVDDAWFSANGKTIPSTLDELAQPDNAKLLVVQNPVESSTGSAFYLALMGSMGEEKGLAYYKSLLEGGTRVDAGWSEAYDTDFTAGEGKGNYPLVLSYSTSPASTEGATSIIESTCVNNAEYAGVVKGAQNPEGAKAFIDFLLSDDVQAAFPENMYMYPVNADIALPEEWAQWAKLPENTIQYDATTVADKREDWLKSWTTMFEEQGK